MAEISRLAKRKDDAGSSVARDAKAHHKGSDLLPVSSQSPAADHLPLLLQRAALAPHSLAYNDLIAVQSAIGMRATRNTLLGTPHPATQTIHRQVDPRASLQRLLVNRAGIIQPKLTVGAADDPYEREADRVAAKVMTTSSSSGPAPAVARHQEDETAQRMAAPIGPHLRLQRDTTDLSGSFDAGADVEQQLAAGSAGGTALPAGLRSELEPKFGADFGDVRIHSGTDSQQLNRKLGAQAFTHRNHIYMGAGSYSPGTASGKRLLAHELTHTLQQNAAPLRRVALLSQASLKDRPAIQRKYADLPALDVKKPNPVSAKVNQYIVNYNKGPLVSTLQGTALTSQIENDKRILGIIENTMADIEEDVSVFHAALETERSNLIKANFEYGKVSGKSSRSTIAPIAKLSFPQLKMPKQGAQVMPGVEYLEAVIGEQMYHLYAGQDYLNTEYSGTRFLEAPTKGGNIKIMPMKLTDEEEEQQKLQKNPIIKAVIGDAHHRFVWGAHHRQQLTAEVKADTFADPTFHWSQLTYKHDPMEEFSLDNLYHKSDDVQVINKRVKDKLLLAAFSPLAPYKGEYRADPETFIRKYLEKFWKATKKRFVVEDEQVLKVKALIDNARVKKYTEAVQGFVKTAHDKDHAKSIGDILMHSFPAGRMPNVALGDTPSVGYYDPETHVIILDPVKNPSPDAMLDTLAFETGNALQRKDFQEKKETTTNIEYRTQEGFFDMLMEATGTYSIDALVTALNIPAELLIPADAGTVLKAKTPALPMPNKRVLPEQKKRSVLAWWMMKDWTDEQRKQYFATSAHAEGMAATGAEYSDKTDEVSGSKELPKPIVGVTHPQPSFHRVVMAINKAYPRAQNWHWQKLLPRHFGEFLLTGTIRGWNAGKEEITAHSPELFTAFMRDVQKVYPNVQNMHLKKLTDTDIGEFMLDGKIQSWETWGTPWSGD